VSERADDITPGQRDLRRLNQRRAIHKRKRNPSGHRSEPRTGQPFDVAYPEDRHSASFAGQYLTRLNLRSPDPLVETVAAAAAVWRSGCSGLAPTCVRLRIDNRTLAGVAVDRGPGGHAGRSSETEVS
jgi:hypothetical protein